MNRFFSTSLCLTVICFAQTVWAQSGMEFDNAVVALIDDINVPATDAGQIVELKLKPGQQISKGQIIALQKTADLIAERSVIESEVQIAEQLATNHVNIDYARKSNEVANSNLRRSQEANQIVARSVTRTEIERLALEAEQSRLSIEQAEFEIGSAQMQIALQCKRVDVLNERIENRNVRSPIAGMVLEVPVKEGEWAQSGQTLVRVIRLDWVNVQTLAPADKVGTDWVGKSVKVTAQVAGAEPIELAGKISFINPEVNPATGLLQITAEVENKNQQLRPGAKVKMVVE